MSKKTNTTIVVSIATIRSIIHSIKDGVMFGITFERRTPKCTGCGRSLKSFKGKTHCHFCGSELSFERVTVAQKGVENPGNPSVTKPGQGIVNGISAEKAEEVYNLLKFYDVNAINKDGSKGGYRSCGYGEIKSIRYNSKEYIVE
jgi:hypothetical protein